MPARMRTHHHKILALAALTLLLGAAGCQKPTKDAAGGGSAGSGQGSAAMRAGSGSATAQGSGAGSGSAAAPVEVKDIDSKDILARTETSPEVSVKHVLLTWQGFNPPRGRQDPRGAKRSNTETATLAQDLASKLKADPTQIDAMMKEYSEDPGSARSGDAYPVKADSGLVPEFKNLALRLKEKEVGIVKSAFGYHVMIRVPPPPPDPLDSTDILARPGEPGPSQIQQILIGWKDTLLVRGGQGDKRANDRTKDQADKLAKEVLDKVRNKGDMAKLIKEYSEDPSSKDPAKDAPPPTIAISADTPVPTQFEGLKKLALRLKLNESGMIKTALGWHIVKRVPPPPPPPPDSLDSVAILKREPQTAKAKVKHILLGWTGAHATDPRGASRDRAALEKLVKETVAKLAKGGKIEPLMAELSEDPGSAKTGIGYDVTPEAGLVAPFKNLSLRLKVGEVGVVKSDFGIHIIQRVE
jgi:parvulin-like peptidyl-prolyl isomerase